jgi:uncharacterized membrane protein
MCKATCFEEKARITADRPKITYALALGKKEDSMENILVVVFDSEKEAYEGLSVLNQLDCDGIITVYAGTVIQKDASGTVSITETQGNFPSETIAGTALGSLIGLLGGPAGFGLGATIGGLTGIIRDLHAARVNSHFVDDVAAMLKPGKFAVAADVSEELIAPINTRMEVLGGIVFRTEKDHFQYELRAREVAEISVEIEELKREQAVAIADSKAKIQAQIDSLSRKLQVAQTEVERWAEQIKRETEAEVQVLQKKAAKAQGEVKASINARIDQLRKQYEDSVTKLRNVTAEKLRETAVKIQKAG